MYHAYIKAPVLIDDNDEKRNPSTLSLSQFHTNEVATLSVFSYYLKSRFSGYNGAAGDVHKEVLGVCFLFAQSDCIYTPPTLLLTHGCSSFSFCVQGQQFSHGAPVWEPAAAAAAIVPDERHGDVTTAAWDRRVTHVILYVKCEGLTRGPSSHVVAGCCIQGNEH